jgi:hypothetical protein
VSADDDLHAERVADAADLPPESSSEPRFGHLLPGAAHGKLPARSEWSWDDSDGRPAAWGAFGDPKR